MDIQPVVNKVFFVEEDLCTGCGDCWKALPKNFRDTGEDFAEVFNTEVHDLAQVEKVMKDCPGKAILWKK